VHGKKPWMTLDLMSNSPEQFVQRFTSRSGQEELLNEWLIKGCLINIQKHTGKYI